MKHEYTIRSDDQYEIEMAIKGSDSYNALLSIKDLVRAEWKYGNESKTKDEVIAKLYQSICDEILALGIDDV